MTKREFVKEDTPLVIEVTINGTTTKTHRSTPETPVEIEDPAIQRLGPL